VTVPDCLPAGDPREPAWGALLGEAIATTDRWRFLDLVRLMGGTGDWREFDALADLLWERLMSSSEEVACRSRKLGALAEERGRRRWERFQPAT
jgi:hypothetical protein